jgi:Heterokaryon incompatibility protein (HET)
MAQNPLYQHFRLTSDRSIRLLSLEPSQDSGGPIKCSLIESSLDYIPNFTALSYSWDAQTPCHPVLARTGSPKPGAGSHDDNYSTLNVTLNCLAAMRQLRHVTEAQLLWIDSICIDQSSIDERNEQVALMGELYACAKQVIVWLGEKDEATERAMLFINEFNENQLYRDGTLREPAALREEALAKLMDLKARKREAF